MFPFSQFVCSLYAGFEFLFHWKGVHDGTWEPWDEMATIAPLFGTKVNELLEAELAKEKTLSTQETQVRRCMPLCSQPLLC